MSIVQFLRILLARWRIIAVAFVACFAVATAIAMVLPKRYVASARVILDVVKPDPVTGQVLAGPAMRSYMKTQSELVTDYRVTGAVVDKLGLANAADMQAAFQGANAGSGVDIRRFAADQIGQNVGAEMIDNSNILQLTYTGGDPAQAKAIVDALRDAYIAESLRLKTEGAGRTADWYRDQAERARQQLIAAEDAKTKFMRETGIVIDGSGATAVDAETAKLQQLAGAAMSARGQQGGQESALAQRLANDPAVDGLRLQVATAKEQLIQAGERLGPKHPSYIAAQSRVSMLEGQLAAAQAASRAGVNGATSAARGNVTELQHEYDAQKARVLGMKDNIDKLGALQREVDLRRSLYERAAARTAELRLQANVNETEQTILGEPFSPGTPSWPKIPLIAALAAAFGLALGIATALVIEFIARRVRGLEDLEYATGAPVLAVVREARRSPIRAWFARRLIRRRGTELADPIYQAAE